MYGNCTFTYTWLAIRMARFTKSPMRLAQSVISEAHAKHSLTECQGIELQKVPVLIPTTSVMHVHFKVELIELRPSDNREELLQEEGTHMGNQENYVAAFHLPPKRRSP